MKDVFSFIKCHDHIALIIQSCKRLCLLVCWFTAVFIIWICVSVLLTSRITCIKTWHSGKFPFDCQKIAKNLTFKKKWQKLSFFSTKLPMAFFWQSNGNFPEGQIETLYYFVTWWWFQGEHCCLLNLWNYIICTFYLHHIVNDDSILWICDPIKDIEYSYSIKNITRNRQCYCFINYL